MRLCFGSPSFWRGGGIDLSSAALTIHSALFATALAESARSCIHFVRCSHLLGFIIQDCGQFPTKSQNAQGMSIIESIVE